MERRTSLGRLKAKAKKTPFLLMAFVLAACGHITNWQDDKRIDNSAWQAAAADLRDLHLDDHLLQNPQKVAEVQYNVAVVLIHRAYVKAGKQTIPGAENPFVWDYIKAIDAKYPEVAHRVKQLHQQMIDGTLDRSSLARHAGQATEELRILKDAPRRPLITATLWDNRVIRIGSELCRRLKTAMRSMSMRGIFRSGGWRLFRRLVFLRRV